MQATSDVVMNTAFDYFEENRETILQEYFELLKFPSVGANPLHLRDCINCAMWFKKWLTPLGFQCKLLQSEKYLGAPSILFAERKGVEGAPTVLFYGHYDVQPADPIDAWDTPPFEPELRNGRVYARGAQDDKGQTLAFLNGVKALILESPDNLPTIKIILEGQEEVGSMALEALAPSLKEELKADVMLVCDTSAAAEMRPAIVAGLRGVAHFTMTLQGAAYDLHSGEHGGIAPNPAQGIAELVASLHDCMGAVAVRGFYDGIEEPSEEERAAAESAAVSPEEYEATFGCAPVGGEEGKTLTERNSFRPTIEVNGIHSGYGGEGSKTVIPASAIAKISMRLVPGQNPERVMKLVEKHLLARTPRGMKLNIDDVMFGAGGFRLPLASPIFRLASAVLEEMDERGAVYQWDGASIPIVSILKQYSGAAPLLVGFGQAEDRIHSPNESFSIEQFKRCMEWAYRIVGALR